MADKTEACRRLAQYQLATPISIRITQSNIEELAPFRDAHARVEFWYLRSDDRKAPGVARVAATSDLVGMVQNAVRTYSDIVFIVQERVNARHSGVMAVLSEVLFIEHVVGELRALLREGVSPARTLLATSGEELGVELGRQEFQCSWEGVNFVRTEVPSIDRRLSLGTYQQLLSAGQRVSEHSILEWIESPSGEVVFLDYRPTTREFLVGREALLSGLESGHYTTLQSTLENPLASIATIQESGIYRVERPLYDYIDSILPVARGIIAEAGGILSHLCVYASEKGIPCLVLRRRGEEMGSV